MKTGYQALVLSDHGMDESGRHEDDRPICRECPCWPVGHAWQGIPMPERARDVVNIMRRLLLAENQCPHTRLKRMSGNCPKSSAYEKSIKIRP